MNEAERQRWQKLLSKGLSDISGFTLTNHIRQVDHNLQLHDVKTEIDVTFKNGEHMEIGALPEKEDDIPKV